MRFLLALALASLPFAPSGTAQTPDVEIRVEQVSEGIYVLFGRGGNIGMVADTDGVFLVDDQYAPLTPLLLEAIGEITAAPLRFVLNTHWHGDHTGGNENMGAEGALIVAHENVRARMSTDQFSAFWDRTTPASDPAALPVVTFRDAVTFHLAGYTVRAVHVPPAHTDGDAVVFFPDADVVHMGDLFFNGLYPFIDVDSGGDPEGMLAAVQMVLAETGRESVVIPGHGPITDRDGLQTYADMLEGVIAAVQATIDAGMSEDEAVEANPTAPWDAAWGGAFIDPEAMTRLTYRGLTD